jgi:hypothetical protein
MLRASSAGLRFFRGLERAVLVAAANHVFRRDSPFDDRAGSGTSAAVVMRAIKTELSQASPFDEGLFALSASVSHI